MSFTMPNFPLLSFDQANPQFSAQNAATAVQQNRAALQKAQLENALQQIKLKYADPEEQAALQQAQALPGLTNAQAYQARGAGNYSNQMASMVVPQAQAQIQQALATALSQRATAGYTTANTNLLKQQTPFLTRQEEEKIYSDPLIARQYQLQQALKTGAIPRQTLENYGFIPKQGQQTAPLPQPQAGAPSQQQPAYINALANMLAPNATPSTSPNLYTGTPDQNFAYTGSPISPFIMAQLKANATEKGKTQVTNTNELLKDSASQATDANDLMKTAEQFHNAYQQSAYKGSYKGSVPSSGAATALVPGDLSPEQTADAAGKTMQLMMAKLYHLGKLNQSEFDAFGRIKLSRNMEPMAEKAMYDFITAKSQRIVEMNQLMNQAINKGIDPNTARAIANKYDNEMPVFNFEDNKVNSSNINKGSKYLSPQAINSITTGSKFSPYDDLTKDDLKKLSKGQIRQIQRILAGQ